MSHSYKTIYNWPEERQRKFYTWCYWQNAFNDEELDKVVKLMDSVELERGTTVGQKQDANANNKIVATQAPNEAVRKSDVRFWTYDNGQGKADWIFHRLNNVIEGINNQFYNFDINGYESFQYTVYHGKEKGKYDFHQDTIMGKNLPPDMYECRKLSITFLLNDPKKDFKGGDFQINSGEEKNAESIPMNKGDIIIFPSFLIHRVAPVTKGTRKSIVVWVLGPKFR
tara:strand:+ start:342 stop:1019 length:678 start_codon:yes stop_codon:yes gene_type:complete